MTERTGITCPTCGHDGGFLVTDCRPHEQGFKRRRKCSNCGIKFTTFEVSMDTLDKLTTRSSLLAELHTTIARMLEL